ncbi:MULTISPECIES: hypothetical protein [unclassified Streptomyces]|uniref:hypothetical protein n=1 Tax=unclassified Streptomyces TaxID=2593676 RepID=UPI001BED0B13|nr:hypothetical protein [Streptomyces sp. McG3]
MFQVYGALQAPQRDRGKQQAAEPGGRPQILDGTSQEGPGNAPGVAWPGGDVGGSGFDEVGEFGDAGVFGYLADHRRATAVREEIRLVGEGWDAARTESHATRSAVTAPLLRVRLLLPEPAETKQCAAQAVYDMRASTNPAALQESRERALQAADGLVAAAGVVLAA